MANKGGKDAKKGGEKKKKLSKKWEKYIVSGDKVERKQKSCPKCGVGVFLAAHKDRFSCGKCGYTEFSVKKEEVPKEAEEKSPNEPSAETPEVADAPKGEAKSPKGEE